MDLNNWELIMGFVATLFATSMTIIKVYAVRSGAIDIVSFEKFSKKVNEHASRLDRLESAYKVELGSLRKDNEEMKKSVDKFTDILLKVLVK